MRNPVSCIRNGSHFIVTVDNPPVNTLSRVVREGLVQAVKTGTEDKDSELILISCEGTTFIAGADIAELNSGLKSPGLTEFIEACDACSKPIIGVIHGHCFGGGLVVALACDYRICTSDATFAMPEVGLGLLPTFGGTQNLPRLVGTENAAHMILHLKTVNAEAALRQKLVDRIIEGQTAADVVSDPTSSIPAMYSIKRRVAAMTDHYSDDVHLILNRFQHLPHADLRKERAYRLSLGLLARWQEDDRQKVLRDEHAMFIELLNSAESVALRQDFFSTRSAGKTLNKALD
jgi:3-hydroxyacyl-CoA dehydrogenase